MNWCWIRAATAELRPQKNLQNDNDTCAMNIHQEREHYGKSFAKLSCTGASLDGFVFEECTFTSCSIGSSSFAHARFVGCTFANWHLSNAKFVNARLRECSFAGCKLLGIQWVQLDDLVNPSFTDCSLHLSNFTALKMKKTALTKCDLREVEFSQADFSECDFRASDFRGAKFNGTNLVKSDFRDAVNYLIDPTANKVKGAHFNTTEAIGLLYGLGIKLS